MVFFKASITVPGHFRHNGYLHANLTNFLYDYFS